MRRRRDTQSRRAPKRNEEENKNVFPRGGHLTRIPLSAWLSVPHLPHFCHNVIAGPFVPWDGPPDYLITMVRDTHKHTRTRCMTPPPPPRTVVPIQTYRSSSKNKLTPSRTHTPLLLPPLTSTMQCHDPGTPDIVLVNACINGGVDINLQDSHGCTAMNWVRLRLLHLLFLAHTCTSITCSTPPTYRTCLVPIVPNAIARSCHSLTYPFAPLSLCSCPSLAGLQPRSHGDGEGAGEGGGRCDHCR